MTTPDRIVINAQTARHEVQRLVNVAHMEAIRQKRHRYFMNLLDYTLWLILWAFIGIALGAW